jgi:tripartite-type tricarboxylate transporter receptor subunit TctC
VAAAAAAFPGRKPDVRPPARPAGTPPAIVQKLFEATQATLKLPNVKASLAREGTDVSLSSSPAQFAKFLSEDEKFWVKLVKSADVSVD